MKRDTAFAHVLTGNVAEGEIDRYIWWPGQSPFYMIGRERNPGDRFDIRVIHDRVLENGIAPLASLHMVVTQAER